jgi:hypothetical protein
MLLGGVLVAASVFVADATGVWKREFTGTCQLNNMPVKEVWGCRSAA